MVEYSEGEKVLSFHGPMLYEARIQSVELRPSASDEKKTVRKYLIHYLGWNKSWDEWVEDDRIRPLNEENLQLMAELGKKNQPSESKKREKEKEKEKEKDKDGEKEEKTKQKTSQPNTPAQSSKAATPTPKKRKIDSIVETEEETASKTEIKLQLPPALKKKLYEDWYLINTEKMLITLPPKSSISAIITDYLQSKNRESGQKQIHDVMEGLQDYFEAALENLLIYKFERPQLTQYMKDNEGKPNLKHANHFGVEHLLRLLVKFPELLANTDMDEEAVKITQTRISDFMSYLAKNIIELSSSYEAASLAYVRSAEK